MSVMIIYKRSTLPFKLPMIELQLRAALEIIVSM